MKRLIALILLCTSALVACSGQGNFTFDVKANTPTPLAGKSATPAAGSSPTNVPVAAAKSPTNAPIAAASATPAAETDEQLPSPGGLETSTEKLPADVVVLIQTQVAGQAMVGAPRAFIVPQIESQVEGQYTQMLNARGWQNVSSSAGLTGKAKVMILQKGKMKAHVIFVNQSNSEIAVYILMTKA